MKNGGLSKGTQPQDWCTALLVQGVYCYGIANCLTLALELDQCWQVTRRVDGSLNDLGLTNSCELVSRRSSDEAATVL